MSEAKSKLDVQAIYNLLSNYEEDVFATTLLTICLINYGDETFKVDPLVLFAWLEEDFGTEVSEINQNKLNAILAALTTDYFYNDLSTFKSICSTLTEGDPGVIDTELIGDETTIPEILWGIYEVSLCNDETVVNTYKFSNSIQSFINIALKENPLEQADSSLELSPSEENIIKNNCIALSKQLLKIGIKELPKFPALEIDL